MITTGKNVRPDKAKRSGLVDVVRRLVVSLPMTTDSATTTLLGYCDLWPLHARAAALNEPIPSPGSDCDGACGPCVPVPQL